MSSDASASHENPSSDWGVRVDRAIIGQTGKKVTRNEFRVGRPSINPQDLLVAARYY